MTQWELDRVPTLVDAFEGSQGDFVTLQILVMQRAGFRWHPSYGIRKLVACTDQLKVDALMSRLPRVVSQQIQPLPDSLKPILATLETRLKCSPLLEIDTRGIAWILEGIRLRLPIRDFATRQVNSPSNRSGSRYCRGPYILTLRLSGRVVRIPIVTGRFRIVLG